MPTGRAVAVALAAALTLASCSQGGGGTTGEATASASPSPTSTVSVPPAVTLTEPATDLSFGEPASVIFEPTQQRGTVLELTVEKAAEGSTKDFSGFVLDEYTRSATPYYVDVTVENIGEGDVGGVPIPLWGVDAENTLLPAASFTTSFRPCASEQLPKKFEPGDSMQTCLVYLAPDGGTLEGVSFRPDQEVAPIQWTGEIAAPKPESKKPKKNKKNSRQR